MMRHQEPGYVLCSMQDPARRRGIWMRSDITAERLPTYVELCGGREGDDAHVRLEVGAAVTEKMLVDLEDVLGREAWMHQESQSLRRSVLATVRTRLEGTTPADSDSSGSHATWLRAAISIFGLRGRTAMLAGAAAQRTAMLRALGEMERAAEEDDR